MAVILSAALRATEGENVGMEALVHVHSTPTATEGHLMRSRLEAEGIPVFVKGEGDGPYRMGALHLWVEARHEVQARLVIAEVGSGSLALTEEDADTEAD